MEPSRQPTQHDPCPPRRRPIAPASIGIVGHVQCHLEGCVQPAATTHLRPRSLGFQRYGCQSFMSLVVANIKADDELRPSVQSRAGQRSHGFRAGVRTPPRALMLAGVECRGRVRLRFRRGEVQWARLCTARTELQTDATDLHATLEVVVPNICGHSLDLCSWRAAQCRIQHHRHNLKHALTLLQEQAICACMLTDSAREVGILIT